MGVELVEMPGALGLLGDQAGVFEDTEVLGDGWAAYGEVAGELAYGLGAVEKAGEDGSAGGVAEGVEFGSLVRIHLR